MFNLSEFTVCHSGEAATHTIDPDQEDVPSFWLQQPTLEISASGYSLLSSHPIVEYLLTQCCQLSVNCFLRFHRWPLSMDSRGQNTLAFIEWATRGKYCYCQLNLSMRSISRCDGTSLWGFINSTMLTCYRFGWPCSHSQGAPCWMLKRCLRQGIESGAGQPCWLRLGLSTVESCPVL